MVEAMDTEQAVLPLPEGRLVITKMIMTDFKSYAGEQVVGEFHKVSPAGCLNPTLGAPLSEGFKAPVSSGKYLRMKAYA